MLQHGTYAESGAVGMRESDPGSHILEDLVFPSHRMGFHIEAVASLVNLEAKILKLNFWHLDRVEKGPGAWFSG